MLITSAGNAQTALPDDTLRTVEGKVVNENGEAVEYATVALLTVTDSSVVSGALTDSVGRFSLTTSLADSRLMVRVTMVGYAAIYSRLPLRAPLRLIHKANELKEVTVTAARNFVKTNALGLTVEMEGNPPGQPRLGGRCNKNDAYDGRLVTRHIRAGQRRAFDIHQQQEAERLGRTEKVVA